MASESSHGGSGRGANSPSDRGRKQCVYFARGSCKKGSACRFIHGPPENASADLGEHQQQQKLHEQVMLSKRQRPSSSSQLMGAAAPFVPSPRKKRDLLLQQQKQQEENQRAADLAATAMILGSDEQLKYLTRSRMETSEHSGSMKPVSRLIHLSFPADSTFTEEDISNYFSNYGPVQDVTFPFQRKRVFGFVTFVHPETVKFILSIGIPHIICDSTVLVNPYKEKEKTIKNSPQSMKHGSDMRKDSDDDGGPSLNRDTPFSQVHNSTLSSEVLNLERRLLQSSLINHDPEEQMAERLLRVSVDNNSAECNDNDVEGITVVQSESIQQEGSSLEHDTSPSQVRDSALSRFISKQPATSISKGAYIIIRGRPCKVVQVHTPIAASDDSTDFHFVGIDIFKGRKFEDIVPSSHICDVPYVVLAEYQLIDISGDGFARLVSESGNTRDDLRLPANKSEWIKRKLEQEKIKVIVMSAMGEAQICSLAVVPRKVAPHLCSAWL